MFYAGVFTLVFSFSGFGPGQVRFTPIAFHAQAIAFGGPQCGIAPFRRCTR